MSGPRALLLVTSLGFVPLASCFTGEASLGLPCEDDLACGDGQECLQGICSRPGAPACGQGMVATGEECGTVFFRDGVEVGNNGWTHAIVSAPPGDDCLATMYCFEDTWTRTEEIPALPSHGENERFAWSSGNLSMVRGPGSSRLISPEIDLTNAAAPIVLTFDHYYSFKTHVGKEALDGAIVEVSRDGGDFEQIQLSSYNGVIRDEANCLSGNPSTQNPLLGREAFVGRSEEWVPATASLDAYAGSKIRLGFQIGSDCVSLYGAWFGGEVQWFLDNFAVFGNLAS